MSIDHRYRLLLSASLLSVACTDDATMLEGSAADTTDNPGDGDPGDGDPGDGDPGDGDGDGDGACGNGIVEPGEGCDDGNGVDDDACTNACALATCGDGVVHPGEQCDDGDADNTDACLGTCVNASCGDGFRWSGTEECDDANTENTDACLDTCLAADCGDGFLYDGVEACDDGNLDDLDACSSQCNDAYCGDGLLWLSQEECDDGNNLAEDGCTALCTNEPNPPNNWIFRTNDWGHASTHRFRTIANFADDDMWFLGESVVHFDGSWLTSYEVPFGENLLMLDNAIAPNGHIWATDIQKLYHYDGSGWATVDFQQPYHALGVWRSPTGVVWIGAEDGNILRSTVNNTWEEVACPVVEDVASLWGTDDTHIWAATTAGTILKWDGSDWQIDDQVDQGLVRIRGLDENNIQVVSPTGDQREWDGQIWKDINALYVDYYDMWWPTPENRCAVGGNPQDEGVMSCYDGDSWQHIKPPSTGDWIDTMTGLSDGRRIATDEGGGIQTLSPQSGWLDTVELSDQYPYTITGAWYRADDDIWAVSGSSHIVHFDGTNWTQTQQIDDDGKNWAMSGFGNTAWVAHEVGVMWRFDGNGWVSENVPVATMSVSEIEVFAEGEGWAVMSSGNSSGLLRMQNNVWSNATPPGIGPIDIYAIATDDAYLIGGSARLYHWDGANWTQIQNLPLGDNPDFRAIDGNGPDNIWIVGNDDTVLQWDGVGWTEHDISFSDLYPEDFRMLDVDVTGDMWTRSNRFYRHHLGQWSVTQLPFLETSYETVRASDTSRWWLGSRFVEIRH